jgi:PAS domain S-box-containing protein
LTSSIRVPGPISIDKMRASLPIVVVMTVAAGMNFALDLVVPLGVGIPFTYLLIVLLGVIWATPRQVVVCAAICCALTVLAAILNTEGSLWEGAVNRVMAIAAMCLVAYFGLRYRRAARALEFAGANLDSDNILQTVFKLASTGYSLANVDFTFIRTNPAFQTMLGYSEEELLQKTVIDLLHPDDISRKQALHEALLNDGETHFDMETRYVAKDGGLVTTQERVAVIRNGFGDPRFTATASYDITESAHIRAQARIQNEMLEKVVEHIPVMVVYYAADKKFTWVNRYWQTVLGWSSQDVHAPDIMEKLYPDSDDRMRTAGFISAASGEWGEFRTRAKDGRVVDTSWANIALSDGTNIGFGIDLSQRKQSEAKFGRLLEAAPDAMVIADHDGRIVLVNAQAEKLFGYARAELIGAPVETLIPQRYGERHAQHRARFSVSPRFRAMGAGLELYGRRKDGGEFQVEISLSPLETREGVLISSAIRDVTEREQTVHALRESQKLLAHAQALAHLGYWTWDSASDEVTWSDELFRIYGLEPDTHVPSFADYLERIVPGDRSATKRKVEDALMNGSSFRNQERVARPDGEIRHLISHGAAITDGSGRTQRMVGTCLDVTEQMETEAALKEAAAQLRQLSQKLAESQEIERRKLAVDLHDRVGQNLTALSMNLAIITQRISAADEDVLRRLRDSSLLIESTTACVEGVLDELRPPMLEEWGLHAVLSWYADLFAHRSEITVNVKSQGNERRLRQERETALFRIAQESLNNIAKHARAGHVEIMLDWGEALLSLEISDDGVGFDAATPEFSGGLGTITMRERAQTIGGDLNIEAVPGSGTHIVVTVPY